VSAGALTLTEIDVKMTLALKGLWAVDGIALVLALAWVAMASKGQDAAGRGIMWALPAVLAISLLASYGIRAASSSRGGVIAAAFVAAVPFFGLLWWGFLSGTAAVERRRVASGATVFPPGSMRTMASAIAAGDTATMGQLVRQRGIDLNASGPGGETLLGFAMDHRPDAVPTLLALGADVRRTPAGGSPYAVRAIEAPPKVFAALVAAGADLDVKDTYGEPIVFSPLNHQNAERALQLINLGANVKVVDSRGRTTLMQAVENRLWEVALALLDAGVDPSVVAPDGTSVATIVERQLGYFTERDRADSLFVRLRTRLEAGRPGS
jgi:hypothetical protein